MFFNVRGIKWTLLAIMAVIALCALDLHCSNARDRAVHAKDEASVGGVISHVREEIAAGRRERVVHNMDQINDQLRDLRVIARRMVKAGKKKDLNRVFAAIQELEEMKKRLKEKAR